MMFDDERASGIFMFTQCWELLAVSQMASVLEGGVGRRNVQPRASNFMHHIEHTGL